MQTYYDRLTVQSKAEEQASRLLREATKESCSEVAELAQEHDSMRERSRSSYTRKQVSQNILNELRVKVN